MNWVGGINRYSHCERNNCEYAKELAKTKEDTKRFSRSPFWRFVRFIMKKNEINTNDGKWTKQVIWNNLYKASYEDCGNPEGFYEQQKTICDQILIEEIKLNKPTKIYFITEKNLKNNEKDFSPLWLCKEDFPELITYLESRGDIESFVSKRPEGVKFNIVYNNIKTLEDLFYVKI